MFKKTFIKTIWISLKSGTRESTSSVSNGLCICKFVPAIKVEKAVFQMRRKPGTWIYQSVFKLYNLFSLAGRTVMTPYQRE